jgi:hypothetical protein
MKAQALNKKLENLLDLFEKEADALEKGLKELANKLKLPHELSESQKKTWRQR